MARWATIGLGAAPVAAVSDRIWASGLRVLAYHRVPHADPFEDQVELIARRYQLVSEAEVRAAFAGGQPLGPRSVWITFDDGDPSVVDVALPVLQRHGASATLYACPGLIESGSAPWWEIVEAAGSAGQGAEVEGRPLVGGELVRALKRVPDSRRREVLDVLRPHAGAVGDGGRAITTSALERWIEAGGTVGNHTWDHPCLDQCAPAEQADQIERAHHWMRQFQPDHVPTFAYPNGDRTDHAERVLGDLGYDLALLFDHRMSKAGAPPLRTSRLRLDADAPLSRTRAILSGSHSALLGVGG